MAKKEYDPAMMERAAQMYRAGRSLRQIAAELSASFNNPVSHVKVREWLATTGLERRRPGRQAKVVEIGAEPSSDNDVAVFEWET